MHRILLFLCLIVFSQFTANAIITFSFTNDATIAIPETDSGSYDPGSPANPYPSAIEVAGVTGAVANVRVTLRNISHTAPQNIDMLLTGPNGANLLMWSDVGSTQALDPMTIAIDDRAVLILTNTGFFFTSHRPYDFTGPENGGNNDNFPAPAPAISTNKTFDNAFANSDPNGTWNLYIIDDTPDDVGTVASGWSLDIVPGATVTLISSVPTISDPTQQVTFTATVRQAGVSVGSSGFVVFKENGVVLPNGGSAAVSLGIATYTSLANFFTVSNHLITAEYRYTNINPAVTFSATATVTQVVDRPTMVNGSTFFNPATIALPQAGLNGRAGPYPSHIVVSGLAGTITGITLTLSNLFHTFPDDIDMMLVSPDGLHNVVVMSDVGGGTAITNVILVFDDAGTVPLPNDGPLASGTFMITNVADAADAYPGPAPSPSNDSRLADAFNGLDPNGIWTLYAMDETGGNIGAIAGGWGLTFTTTAYAPTITIATTSHPTYATAGQTITITAAVLSASSPVTSGTLTFKESNTILAGPFNLTAAGQTNFSTSSLSPGLHMITAQYNGSAGAFNVSSATLLQMVEGPTVVQGKTFYNVTPMPIPVIGADSDGATAAPYPSHITVSGISRPTAWVAVTISNLSHVSIKNVDMMLAGPAGGTQNIVFLSDAGVSPTFPNPVTPVSVTFSDSGSQLSGFNAITTGTYTPTNSPAGGPDIFPAPAPTPTTNTKMNQSFGSIDPNGVWQLYVVDDTAGSTGVIAGGWSITICSPPLVTAPNSVCAHEDAFASSETASNYSWTISNGTIVGATNQATVKFRSSSGPISLQLVATTFAGCITTNTTTITVNPAVTSIPIITLSPTNVVAGSTNNHATASLASGPWGTPSLQWSITNGTITSATNIPTITYTAGSTNNIKLTVLALSLAGCTNGTSKSLVIRPYVLPNVTAATFQPPFNLAIKGAGSPGSILAVEKSTDLSTWVYFTNVFPANNGIFQFLDNITNIPVLFYRTSPTNQY